MTLMNKIDWIKQLRNIDMHVSETGTRPGLKAAKEFVEAFYAAVEEDVRDRDRLQMEFDELQERRDVQEGVIASAQQRIDELHTRQSELRSLIAAGRRFARPYDNPFPFER